MRFQLAYVKAIKADLNAKEITITLRVPLEQLETAEELAHFMGRDAQDVTLDITPRQLPMFEKERKP